MERLLIGLILSVSVLVMSQGKCSPEEIMECSFKEIRDMDLSEKCQAIQKAIECYNNTGCAKVPDISKLLEVYGCLNKASNHVSSGMMVVLVGIQLLGIYLTKYL